MDFSTSTKKSFRLLPSDFRGSKMSARKALVAQHEGNSATARRLFGSAQKFWWKADPDLPELTAMRPR